MRPDSHPRILPKLVEAWFLNYEEDQLDRPKAVEDTLVRASWAGQCARMMHYNIIGAEATEPNTVADYWRFWLGTTVHDAVEKFLEPAFGDDLLGVEVVGDLRPEVDGSLHGDILIQLDGKKIACELKSMNGFAFKMAAAQFKGGPTGPRWSAVQQGALFAHSQDADELVVMVLALENISPSLAAKTLPASPSELEANLARFGAEWTFGKAEFEKIASDEIERMNAIAQYAVDGGLPERSLADPEYPDGAVVIDPRGGRKGERDQGMWAVRDEGLGGVVESGSYWGCAYCEYQTRCERDGE